jgi:hypothetical protein
MYVAAFMAVTGIVQATESEAAGSDTPSVKEKKSLFESARGRVSSFADRARQKINGSEQKANENIAKKEEKANENIAKASRTLGTIRSKVTETAACVKKEVYAIELPILRAQSDFFAEQKKRIDMQISDLITKGAAAERACFESGESAELAEEKKEGRE